MKKEQTHSSLIKNKAKELGFLDCGISRAHFLQSEKKHLISWLENEMHGEMGYMERNIDKRLDPRLLVNNAKSVVSVLLNYYPEQKQLDTEAPVLSKYAYGEDYHFVMKKKLKKLLAFIEQNISACSGRIFVDSAPVLDRAWAAHSGLGWIGKNTNLISAEHGSFFFIGELIIDLELEEDQKTMNDRCGNCTRCIDACPTNALVEPYILDARKCISYQTIEKRGELDESLKGTFLNRVFGCDICQDVCPWNLKSEPHDEPEFKPIPKLMQLTKKEWLGMQEVQFEEWFDKSAVVRAGYHGIRRNLEFITDNKEKK